MDRRRIASDPNRCLLPLARCGTCLPSPLSFLAFWFPKSLRRACFPHAASSLRKPPVSQKGSGKLAVFWDCAVFGEAGEFRMDDLVENIDVKDDGCAVDNGCYDVECFSDSVEGECAGSNSSSENSTSEEPQSSMDSEESSTRKEALGWPMQKHSGSVLGDSEDKTHKDNGEVVKLKPHISEVEMMKEKFAKLLLGEDMSGCGEGVCTSLAISNAITNLCATIFGQLWRLEPLSPEKKSMWQREMDWLLCVTDHIVELVPCWQTFPDGSKLEVMTCRPRSDLYINLPALRKLDNMLLEILESFSYTEFWYEDQGILTADQDGLCSLQRHFHFQEDKWWLPVPRVPSRGLCGETRKQLEHKRECTNQILKAAMAINENTLAEMEVPESYLDSLPKNGRSSLGDVIYRYITSDDFSPECLLDCLDFASEHQALEIANRVEASIYVWRQRPVAKPVSNTNQNNFRPSWGMVKEMIVEGEKSDKRDLLADRAETLLMCLKQRFPGLTQTTLDVSKIQFNKDVGKSILESYSRVLESLAFNILARIDDLLSADDLARHSDQPSMIRPAGVIVHPRAEIPHSVPVSSILCATPGFSPAQTRGERSPFIGRKPQNRGFGIKKVLTDYLGVEMRGKGSSD